MIGRVSQRWCVCWLAVFVTGGAACAQGGGGRGPGGPGMGHGPGMSPGMGGPGGNGRNGSLSGNGTVPERGPSLRTSSGVKLGPPGRWWDDSAVSRQVGLSRDQRKKMDAIFDSNKPAILDSYKTFTAQQGKLTAISKDPKAEQAQVFAAVDAVSEARASLQKATIQMLLQIRGQLEPSQLARLDNLP